MPAERVAMRQVREIIRLKTREIARRLGTAASTVRETLRRFEGAGLGWPLPDGMSDGDLEAALYANHGTKRRSVKNRPAPLCLYLPFSILSPSDHLPSSKVLMLASKTFLSLNAAAGDTCSKRACRASRRCSRGLLLLSSPSPTGRCCQAAHFVVLKIYYGLSGTRSITLRGPGRWLHKGGPQGLTRDANRAQAALFDARTKCEPLCQFCVS
jgi:hypothetical protein